MIDSAMDKKINRDCCFGKHRIFIAECYSYSCILGESASCSHNELKYDESVNCQMVTCCSNQKFPCDQCSVYMNHQEDILMNEVVRVMEKSQPSEKVTSNEKK